MTAPDAFAAPQKALAERGPSIHDGRVGFDASRMRANADA